MTNLFPPNIYQVSETLNSARHARRRAYAKAALAELNANVGPELGAVALSMALVEIWQDHADATATPIRALEDCF